LQRGNVGDGRGANEQKEVSQARRLSGRLRGIMIARTCAKSTCTSSA
jgi:hypothetical protein